MTRWAIVLLVLLVAGRALAVDVYGTSATLGWTAASGAPTGYECWTSRNAAASTLQGTGPGLTCTITGVVGESIVVKVRAVTTDPTYDSPGPFSPDSLPIVFRAKRQLGAPGAPVLAP